MERFNAWLLEVSNSPLGSFILFLGVFLTRVAIDQWNRQRQNKRKKKRTGAKNGRPAHST